MFPIVQILKGQGFSITGSDNNEGDIVDLERKMGIPVTIGQKAENIRGADMIVYTAAILEGNPELEAAKASGLPMWERAQMLGVISSCFEDAVCVCGTHGKTTTTAMLTQIFLEAGKDPSAVIGGKLPAIGGYGRAGESSLFAMQNLREVRNIADKYNKPVIFDSAPVSYTHLDVYKRQSNAPSVSPLRQRTSALIKHISE